MHRKARESRKKSELSPREAAWQEMFIELFPHSKIIFQGLVKTSPTEALTFVLKTLPPSTHHSVAIALEEPCSKWQHVDGILLVWKKSHPELAAKIDAFRVCIIPELYGLTEKEIGYAYRFLKYYPDQFDHWEKCFGKTPAEVAHVIVAHFTESMLLTSGQLLLLKNYLCAAKTWDDLDDRLRQIPYVAWQFPEKALLLIDFSICLVEHLLRRTSRYAASEKNSLTRSYVQKARTGSFQLLKLLYFGVERAVERFRPRSSEHDCYFVELSEIPFKRCRFCWRGVPVHPHKASRMAPLCFFHTAFHTHPEYRSARRVENQHRQYKYDLAKKLNPLYQATKTPLEAWNLIRGFLLDENSPLPLTAQYMRQHCARDADAREILAAFHGPLDQISHQGYKEALLQQIDFLVQTPMPIHYAECLDMEAWLQLTRDKRRKSSASVF